MAYWRELRFHTMPGLAEGAPGPERPPVAHSVAMLLAMQNPPSPGEPHLCEGSRLRGFPS